MTITRPRQRRTDTASHQEPWAGTLRLWLLALRLDRVRIAVWTLAVAVGLWATAVSLDTTFPDAAARQARADLMGNPSAMLLTGPAYGLDNYTLGAMLANEMSLILLVAVAIMSILLAVRHSRAEEESGRLEMVRSLAVGRFAPAAATLLTVVVANLAVGAAVTSAAIGSGLAGADSVVFGAAVAVTGVLFGAVAAVTAQLTEHSRGASGMAMAVLGAAFLVRGVGDILEPTGSWLSWFSPIAWAQQTRLYADVRLWPLLLSAVAAVVLLMIAVTLSHRRDLGAGLRPARPGPAAASDSLLSTTGVPRRLLRGHAWGWSIGIAVFALVTGSLGESMTDILEELPEVADMLVIEEGRLLDSFLAAMLLVLMVGVIAQSVGALLRWRAEESAGRVTGQAVAGRSRTSLAAAWLAVVLTQALLSTLLLGVGVGVGMSLSTADWGWWATSVTAALAYFPAVLLTVAFAAVVLGWRPRWAAVAWVVVGYILVVAWLGPALGLPDWAEQASPLAFTAAVPMEQWDPTAAALQVVAAVVLFVLARLGLTHRDLLS